MILVFVLICCLVPPMFHRSVSAARSQAQTESQEAADECTERIRCIDDNIQALEWRLRVINAAQEKIILSTLDFRDDSAGTDIMTALYEAAERGVQVEILVDGFTYSMRVPGGSSCTDALAAHPNIEIRSYNPLLFTDLWRINYRLHDKFLIADEQVYILGGRNTNDLFLGSYIEEYNIDRDVLVYETGSEPGTSLAQLLEYWEELWNLDTNRAWDAKEAAAYEEEYAAFAAHALALRETYPDAYEETDWAAETMEVNSVYLISNQTQATGKSPTVFAQICDLMDGAEDVVIQTPYAVLSHSMYRELSELTDEGTRIALVLNAVQVKNDNPFGLVDYENQRSRILNTGLEVYECMNEHLVHTKAVLIDENICILGSYNLDMRSTYLDTETMLVIDSPQLNAYLREELTQVTDCAVHVLPDGTKEIGAAYESVTLSVPARIAYTVLRGLMLFFRYLV